MKMDGEGRSICLYGCLERLGYHGDSIGLQGDSKMVNLAKGASLTKVLYIYIYIRIYPIVLTYNILYCVHVVVSKAAVGTPRWPRPRIVWGNLYLTPPDSRLQTHE